MKVMVVAGARLNFMKIAPVVVELDKQGYDTVLVHTGQHYDTSKSQACFEALGIRVPDRPALRPLTAAGVIRPSTRRSRIGTGPWARIAPKAGTEISRSAWWLRLNPSIQPHRHSSEPMYSTPPWIPE